MGLHCCAGFSLVLVNVCVCVGGCLVSNCGVPASHCCGFSCSGAQSLGHMGFSSCCSGAQENRFNSCTHWLICSAACGTFRDLGMEPTSPTLVGRFFTIVPPGKAFSCYDIHCILPSLED